MTTIMRISLAACATVLLAPRLARAEPPPVWAGKGIALVAGGGIGGFADRSARDMISTSIGGAWDVRATLGSRMPVALDVSYAGSAANLRGPGAGDQGVLGGTAFEAAFRYNLAPGATWSPYGFVGIGWQRYHVTGATFDLTDAGMRGRDDLAVFPVGMGLLWRPLDGLVVDVRGTARPTFGNELLRADANHYVPMDSWELAAAIGYEL
jgi:hypothetical protein